jgi:PAS domain S-box-containing protein
MHPFHYFKKPLFGVVSLLLIGAVIGVLINRQIEEATRARGWVTHTYVTLDHIERYLEQLATAESGGRGYVITGMDNFLVPYNQAVAKGKGIDAELSQLSQLTADNPVQQARIAELYRLTSQKLNLLKQGNLLIQQGQGPQVQALIKTGKGLAAMNRIRDIATAMEGEEEGLLLKRTKAYEKEAGDLTHIMFGLAVLLMAVVITAFITIQKELAMRRKIERTLRDKTRFQEAVLNDSSYMIVATDADGVIRLANPAVERLTGYTPEELVDKQTPGIFHDPEETALRSEQLSAALGRVVKPGMETYTLKAALYGSEEREWTFIRKNGSRLTVLLNVAALHDDDGNVNGFVGITKDITASKEVERIKNEFISTVSHELRTPLTSIRGSLGLVAGNAAGDVPDKARRLIDIAYKNSERLVRLINDILDIEKIESGKMVFDNKPLSVDALMKRAMDDNEGIASRYDVTLKLAIEADDLYISGDFDRLLQAITNLVSNAVKFSPPQSQVQLSAVRIGNDVRLTVVDNGPGIPDTFKPHIFGRFAQADSTDTRQKGGTGLGLNITKAIVEAMKGSIGFESRPCWTEFYMVFPFLPMQAPAQDNSPATDMQRILICEDDHDIAALLQMILEREGYNCGLAYSAAEARQMLAARSYSAMTLDLALPDEDGITLLQSLRKDTATASLPVIVISAQAEAGRKRLNGEAFGILDWLTKPIDLAALRRALASIGPASRLAHVLHVEDDEDIARILAISLQDVAEVIHAATLAEARQKLTKGHFDLVVLDISLPDGNGTELLPLLGSHPVPVPVILLSAMEASKEVQSQVVASMIKSVVSEDKIVQTIKALIHKETA